MHMMNELNHLFLYSARKKVYVPIDEKDKRRNSAILLLTPNLETSNHLMTLPYIYNPDLFTSFYIDRNVSAYVDNMGIENIEFDEKQEEAVSEAMVNSMAYSIKFKFDDHTSIMDEKYIREVYEKSEVKYYAKLLGISKIPDKINVVVHPNLTDLKKKAPKYVKAETQDNFYSYFENDTIHLLSKLVYDPDSMLGSYSIYIRSELLYVLIKSFNPDIPYATGKGIAYAVSGLVEYMEKNKRNTINGGDALNFANTVYNLIKKNGYDMIIKYIRTGDIHIFTKYTLKNTGRLLNKILFESDLSYIERQRLLPSDFGIPDKRKYPIHDEDHVRAAVRMFNNCDPEDEKELAYTIIKKMKRFGINDIKVSASNRFRRYYNTKPIKEYASLNKLNSDYLNYTNPYPQFKDELKDVIKNDRNYCGEIFTDDNGNLIAYYMSFKDDDGNVWITHLKTMNDDKDLRRSLVSRAMDVQNAEFVSVDKDNKDEYKFYSKCGFKDFDTDDNKYLMTISESYSAEHNWIQIKSICSHLDPHELARITFKDTYEDSKFVIKRLIARIGNSEATKDNGLPMFIPAGFLDVYQFPSNPRIAQIVIAVDERFRGRGIANALVEELVKSDLHNQFKFDMYYWTAHTDNIPSQNLAMKHGFIDTGNIDRYGRKVFINKISSTNNIKREIPFVYNSHNGYVSDDNSIITENAAIFFEANDPKYSQKLKNYLYAERMKNNKDVILIYDEVKDMNHKIKRTYLKLKMYKKYNVFVDLSYYHSLFLKNNMYRLDNAVNFYFDFLNRLINNREINEEYSNRTIFVPVDAGIWPVVPGTDISDYRKNLNPISIIFRLIRTNPAALRNAWGNKNFVFLGSRGYFTIDFNKFELKDLSRLKINLNKLMSSTEPIMDDYEASDTINDDPKDNYDPSRIKHSDTTKAMAVKIVDRIEKNTNIKLDDISAINTAHGFDNFDFIQAPHLKIISKLDINNKSIDRENGIVIISIDPEGPEGFTRFNKSTLSAIDGVVTTYCMPK